MASECCRWAFRRSLGCLKGRSKSMPLDIKPRKMNGWSSAAEERLNAVRAEELRWNRGVLMWKGVGRLRKRSRRQWVS